jgi:hypothetical protein
MTRKLSVDERRLMRCCQTGSRDISAEVLDAARRVRKGVREEIEDVVRRRACMRVSTGMRRFHGTDGATFTGGPDLRFATMRIEPVLTITGSGSNASNARANGATKDDAMRASAGTSGRDIQSGPMSTISNPECSSSRSARTGSTGRCVRKFCAIRFRSLNR